MLRTQKHIAAAFSLATALVSTQVSAFDVDSGDFTALPPGTNLSILYTQFITADDLIVDGNTAASNFDLDATIGVYRFVRYIKFLGMTVNPQVLIPFGKQEIGLLDDSSSGLADTIFAATFWTHEDAEKGSYFGIAPFIIAPTGEYDADDPVNLGTNRWSYILQAGYITRLSKNWALDLVADVQWYGDNDDPVGGGSTLKQNEGYQLQSMLRYNFSPRLTAAVKYSWRGGDETRLDGVSQNDEVDTTTLSLYLQYWALPGKLQVQAQYLTDTDVADFGVEREAFQFRFLYLYGQ